LNYPFFFSACLDPTVVGCLVGWFGLVGRFVEGLMLLLAVMFYEGCSKSIGP